MDVLIDAAKGGWELCEETGTTSRGTGRVGGGTGRVGGRVAVTLFY